MKRKIKRILSAAAASAICLSSLFPAAVSAGCYNPADGCKTVTSIKKAATPVTHDGVISPGEYEEIPLVRDWEEEGCDLLFGFLSTGCFEKAAEAAKDIHFYVSWDEQNGLNLAIAGKTLETPKNENTKADWPDDKYYDDDHGIFPGDEFIFQLGAMFRVRENVGTDDDPDFETIVNRSFTRNTTTGDILYGWYWEHGYDNYLLYNPQSPDFDYGCAFNMETHECVFEMSYPLAAVLKSDCYNGTIPNNGEKIYFDMSFVAGGEGKGTEGAENTTYAVSLGDAGYLSDNSMAHPMPATGIFSSEIIGGGETEPEEPDEPSDIVEYPVTGGYIRFDKSTGTVIGCDYDVTEAVIPEKIDGVAVTSIGNGAFSYCRLVKVELPESLTNIGNYAFHECDSLVSIKIPVGVTSIGDETFRMCDNLANVELPESLKSIGMAAFHECGSLASINIPEGVSIGDGAFGLCDSLVSIKIPAGVSIGSNVFYSCKSLESIVVDNANRAYISRDGILFNKDMTELICYPAGKNGTYAIPENVTSISMMAFCGCASLLNIELPQSLTSIGGAAFVNCSSLESIKIPYGVQYIGSSMFRGCSSLESVEIPRSLTMFTVDAFDDCDSLTDIYYNGTEEEWNNIDFGFFDWTTEDIEAKLNATIHFNSTIPSVPTSLSVSKQPTKTEYYVGDSFDGEGMELTVLYNNGDSETVTTDWTADYDFGSVGEKTVTIKWQELTATLTVNVKAKEPTSLTVSKQPTKTEYYVGDSFDGEGMELTVLYNNGDSETVTTDWTADYDFGSVGEKTVTIKWQELTTTLTVNVLTEYVSFADVSEDNWYFEAVKYAYTHGIMNGMTENTFEADKTTTRAMLVTMLYRLDGEPDAGALTFTDVDSEQWYGDAVAWAANNGIVNGVGDGRFDPDGEITREQVATILYRYAKIKGYSTVASADLGSYVDGGEVSSWALDALKWANGAGIVNGKEDSRLDPAGNAKRSEIATMFMRFSENLVK